MLLELLNHQEELLGAILEHLIWRRDWRSLGAIMGACWRLRSATLAHLERVGVLQHRRKMRELVSTWDIKWVLYSFDTLDPSPIHTSIRVIGNKICGYEYRPSDYPGVNSIFTLYNELKSPTSCFNNHFYIDDLHLVEPDIVPDWLDKISYKICIDDRYGNVSDIIIDFTG